jgi:hypothetical protein
VAASRQQRARLRADCGRCRALCCVAPAFARSADFAIDKPAGVPCPHLAAGFACEIHSRLRPSGFAGCAAYDCFGAGQRVCSETLPDVDWREGPAAARRLFATFARMRRLHELLWYLADALARPDAAPLHAELLAVRDATERLAAAQADEPAAADHDSHHRTARELLGQAGDLVRGSATETRTVLAAADLMGADLRGADLRGADLRGAYLIGAQLEGADLRCADVMGADMRGANVSGARMDDAIYMTRIQVGAADGDAVTRIPPWLDRPGHWRPASAP